MSVYSLTVGLVLKRGSRTFEFERRLEDGTVVFTDQLDRAPLRMSIGDLSRQITRGEITVVRGERSLAAKDTIESRVVDLSTLDKKFVDEFDLRLRFIRSLRQLGLRRGMRRAILAALPKVATALNTKCPSASAVMRWWRKLDLSEGNTCAVISGHATRVRPRQKSVEVEEIIKATIRKEYCTRARNSLTHVHEVVTLQLESLAQAGVINKDEAHVSTSTISRRVKQDIDGYALDASRYGPAFARRHWRYSLGGAGCTRPLERFEIDHTVLDIVVICDTTGMPLGRPTITVVVDSFSSYVCGFFISFWGTGLSPTLSALKQAILPKDSFLSKELDLKSPWLSYGIPELIAVDNGLEFHSPQFQQAALMLNADIRYCAVRQPWLKPTVERTMRSINAALPTRGKVERRIDNYLPIDPVSTAALPFSSLCKGLLRTFVDVMPFQVNERKLARPYDLFREGIEKAHPPCLPADLRQMDIVVAPSRVRRVGNEGVAIDYLTFNSKELQEMRRRVGLKFSTLVKLPVESLESVFVQDPRSKSWLEVPSCNPDYTDGLSLVQHAAIRKFKKDRLKARNATDELIRRKVELAAYWSSQVKRTRTPKPVIQKLAGLTSAQVLSQKEDLGPAMAQPRTVVADVEITAARRPVQTFSSFSLD